MGPNQRKTATQRSDEMRQRRSQVTELYIKEGLSQRAMAERLGVSLQTIYNDLCAIREEWRTRATDNIEKKKAKELAVVDQIEFEAWRAWLRSIGTTTKTTTITRGKDKSVSTTTETLAGDPRFLDQVHKCIEQRRRIMGLDEPARQTIENPDGGPVAFRLEGLEGAKWLPQLQQSPIREQGPEP